MPGTLSSNVFVYDAIRTPRGRARPDGALHLFSPMQLLSALYAALENRCGLDPVLVEDVVLGCATQVGEQAANIARTSTLYHGWPDSVPGMTVNRYCSSGLDAIAIAASKIASGMQAVSIAGGVEMMSRVKMLSDNPLAFTDKALAEKIGMVLMGIGADFIATVHGISRRDADALALLSQQRAAYAREHSYFRSIIPVFVAQRDETVNADETIRAGSTAESLAAMPAAFEFASSDGTGARLLRDVPGCDGLVHIHTAGNSPAMADGAALVLLGDASAGKAFGAAPRARIKAIVTANADRREVVSGCITATRELLARCDLKKQDVDLFELHEAFAATIVHGQRVLGLNPETLNVNGGCIALGHPLGATGGIVLGTLLDEMERRGLATGVAATSGAAGAGTAVLLERM